MKLFTMHMLSDFCLIILYRFIISPLGLLLALFCLPFSNKLRLGLSIRLNSRIKHQDLKFKASPVWIHCSSGEFEYAKPVIREIKTIFPEQEILVTYFSPSYKKAIESFPGVDAALPLPLDLPGPVFSFLLRFRPKVLLIARTDLWPELLYQVKSRKIPRILFSCTKESRTTTDNILSIFKTWPFKLLSEIHTATEQDCNVLKDWLKMERIFNTGDTRYDQVINRLSNPKPFKNLKTDEQTPCLVAGSTWSEDENILLKATSKFIKEHRLQMILVPHEPTQSHLNELGNRIKNHGLNYQLYSNSTSWDGKNILIVDQLGILADLYKWGDLALIGGSFKASVHSAMESLATGLWTIVGPHHHNNREALDFKKIELLPGWTATQEVKNENDLNNWIEKYLSLSLSEKSKIKTQIQTEVLKRVGASKRLLQHLLSEKIIG